MEEKQWQRKMKGKLVNHWFNSTKHRNGYPTLRHALWMAGSSTVAVLTLFGCGTSSKTKPSVATISFTDANGNTVAPVTALSTGSGIYLDVVVNNDSEQLGANWSVSCSSELTPGTPLPPGQTVDESCGFFTPVHTTSAPVPVYATSGAGIVTFYEAPTAQPKTGTVTLYASSTSNPSAYASVTISILP